MRKWNEINSLELNFDEILVYVQFELSSHLVCFIWMANNSCFRILREQFTNELLTHGCHLSNGYFIDFLRLKIQKKKKTTIMPMFQYIGIKYYLNVDAIDIGNTVCTIKTIRDKILQNNVVNALFTFNEFENQRAFS